MASFDPYGMLSGLTEDTGIFNADPVGNFNFVLTVEGLYDVPLKSVRAFQKVNQYEKIREGGVNDYVHLKRAPIQDAHTIQFERYVSASLLDPLANGAELALPLILWIKRAANNKYETGSTSSDTSSVRLYIFTGATVMSKEYGALDAEHSGLHTEVITVGYKELYIVPNLITYFGGGAGSVGEMGELAGADEKAREEFKEQQEKDHKAALEQQEKDAKAAEEKAKKDAEEAKKHLEDLKVSEAARLEKEKADRAEKNKDHDAMVAAHQAQAKAAAEKAQADAAAAKQHLEDVATSEENRLAQEKQDRENRNKAHDAMVEEHKKQAEAAEKKAKADAEAAKKHVEETEKSEKARLEKEEKAKQEKEQLNQANKIRQNH